VFDAVIIGGGPAGSTAGRLLAQWGHSVVILTAPASSRPGLAECLPPSTAKVFQFLGVQQAIDSAGFFRTTGNSVWWGTSGRRVEPYPEGSGYQVLRCDFDGLLLGLASGAGARVKIGKAISVPSVDGPRLEFESGGKRTRIRARFILDCSGRAGVIGRGLRRKERNSRTIALCGVWRNDPGWKLPDASHTLVEAYGDGWAWLVPVSTQVRYVAFMVDPRETKMVRGRGLAAAYHAELAKTRAFRRLFSQGSLEQAPWGCDASLYTSRAFSGQGFLLAGDAGAFIDPLSSFGVKKAMVSAWVGAVVANTYLRRPAMQETALRFFDDRERQVFEDYLQVTAALFREAAGEHPHPFWMQRSEPFEESRVDAKRVEMRLALESLRRRRSIRVGRAEGVRLEQRAAIEGREIVLRDALLVPGVDGVLDFFESVNLPRLVELAEQNRRVPDMFEAYNQVCPPVALPQFLAALSMLVSKRILMPVS
jgi:flavin-dependent dehydrogenase